MINERIRQLIDITFKGNASALAREIGINNSTLRDIIGARGVNPSYETLCAILRYKPMRISPRWLMLGEGEMIEKEAGSASPDVNILIEVISNLSASNSDLAASLEDLTKTLREMEGNCADSKRK